MLRSLIFDTEELGLETGMIEAAGLRSTELVEFLKEAQSAGYRLLYWNLPAKDEYAGEVLNEVYKGGHFVGAKVCPIGDPLVFY